MLEGKHRKSILRRLHQVGADIAHRKPGKHRLPFQRFQVAAANEGGEPPPGQLRKPPGELRVTLPLERNPYPIGKKHHPDLGTQIVGPGGEAQRRGYPLPGLRSREHEHEDPRHALSLYHGAVDVLTWAYALGALLFWSSAFAGIRAALVGLSPGHLVLIRFLAASAVLLLAAWLFRLPPPARGDWGRFFALGLLGVFGYHTALTFGEVSVTAGSASLLIATSPVFIALFARFFLGERLSRGAWAGLLLAFLGAGLIALGEGEGFGFDPGAVLVLLAALSGSLYFVGQKPLLARYSAQAVTVYTLVAGTLPLLVFLPGLKAALAEAPRSSLLAALYLGVFPGALAYFLWARALARVPASLLASTLYLNPVLAVLIAGVWLGEWPTAPVVAGGLLALLGVGLVQRFNRS